MKKFVLKNSETRFQNAETRFQNAETRFQNAKTALSRIFFARSGMDSAQKKAWLPCAFGCIAMEARFSLISAIRSAFPPWPRPP